MRERVVLAAVDDSTAAAPVLAAARVMASLLEADLDVLHVIEDGGRTAAVVARHAGVGLREIAGQPTAEIIAAAADPAIVLVVVGARGQPAGPRPVGHVATEVVEQVMAPVLVVPPDAELHGAAPGVHRVLVPLEGTIETSDAVSDLLDRLCAAGVEIIGLHVFDATTAPAFWDEPAHAAQSWADEFRSKWCREPTVVDLRLRRGAAPETIVDVAATEGVDLIALSWSRDLSAGRAAVVRGTLAHAIVPVLLFPVDRPAR